ncbi:hypothetical protein QQ045_012313 [Rhodiola kirilowii]
MSWLLVSVSLIVHGQILHAKDVATAWKILHTRYAGSNVSRKFALKRDLGNMKQGDLDLAHYYAKLAKFWEESEAISSVRYMNCVIGDKCGKCTEMEAGRDENHSLTFSSTIGDRKVAELNKYTKDDVRKAFGLLAKSKRKAQMALDAESLFDVNVIALDSDSEAD